MCLARTTTVEPCRMNDIGSYLFGGYFNREWNADLPDASNDLCSCRDSKQGHKIFSPAFKADHVNVATNARNICHEDVWYSLTILHVFL